MMSQQDPATAAEPLVLVIDDDVCLATEVVEVFRRYGFRTQRAETWTEAMMKLHEDPPDAILLDQQLAGIDAVARIPLLRDATTAPILVVTANADISDRILGLEQGADDFLVKPVAGRELVARVRVALRRHNPRRDRPASIGWSLDHVSLSLVSPDGRRTRVTATEFELLVALLVAGGQPVSRETLTRAALGRSWREGGRSIDNAILGLRRKLGHGRDDGPIRTLHNAGYAFIGGNGQCLPTIA